MPPGCHISSEVCCVSSRPSSTYWWLASRKAAGGKEWGGKAHVRWVRQGSSLRPFHLEEISGVVLGFSRGISLLRGILSFPMWINTTVCEGRLGNPMERKLASQYESRPFCVPQLSMKTCQECSNDTFVLEESEAVPVEGLSRVN